MMRRSRCVPAVARRLAGRVTDARLSGGWQGIAGTHDLDPRSAEPARIRTIERQLGAAFACAVHPSTGEGML